MKKLSSFLLVLVFCLLTAHSQNIAWTRYEGSRLVPNYQNMYGFNNWSHDITMDNQGYLYVTGEYRYKDSSGIGITPYVYFGNDSFPVPPIGGFLVKYTSSGTPVWSQNMPGTGGFVMPTAVCVDNQGAVYVVGTLIGTCTFGTTTITSSSTLSEDIFIAKYNAVTQQLIWIKNFGSGSQWANSNMATDIKADITGNIYVTGRYRGQVNFGIGTISSGISTTGDSFLAKFDSNGNAIWTKTTDNPNGNIYSNGLVIDLQDNIYIAGCFFGNNVNFGIGVNISAVPGGWGDMFIAKYDNTGNIQWAQSAGGNDDDWFCDISIDPSGNPYVTGWFNLNANFGNGILLSSSTREAFVVKYDTQGNAVWAKSLGMLSDGRGIHTDANGNSYIFGQVIGISSSYNISVNATHDFIARFDVNGNINWMKPLIYRLGYLSIYGEINAIVAGPDCEIYVSGGFGDNNPVNTNDPFTPITNRDIYVMQINDTLKNCCTISTVYANITITQGQSTTLTATGGDTYQWSNGATDAVIIVSSPITTVYCVTITDANGCTDDTCVTVTVASIDCFTAGELYLPNAFSPNGDGENDVLKIYYGNILCIETFKLVIYNRWGEKVFETTNPAAEWDGSFRGRTEGTAVFVYYLEVKMIDGTFIHKNGNVSLVR